MTAHAGAAIHQTWSFSMTKTSLLRSQCRLLDLQVKNVIASFFRFNQRRSRWTRSGPIVGGSGIRCAVVVMLLTVVMSGLPSRLYQDVHSPRSLIIETFQLCGTGHEVVVFKVILQVVRVMRNVMMIVMVGWRDYRNWLWLARRSCHRNCWR